MNKFLLTLLLIGTVVVSMAQDVPRFAKYPVSTSGCYAYFPADPGSFELQKSEDSLNMYIGEVNFGGAFYSMILVDLGNAFAESGKEELDGLLTQYLDYLQTQLNITGAAGYGMGHTLESNPNATGVIDFWEDAELYQYDVKAWADNHFLAVLMVYSLEEVNYNYKSMFLNGFRFPE
ncbi:MAG: hypothetical protein A2W91_18975 [Bacteroidetes bacterium GWF2_38_335]|nr:MAG: hypothetical protein A2W91_18975 [Bacteroidetes bacterium GWF2_38_335]OFY80243.1 MAG: hypothetical protein A2281_17220 [Bacteroidetes bacterium RIFOXYA12_FULL_38_20]HBS88727.1 hypothetical protein [Bacteroidales bacterium]